MSKDVPPFLARHPLLLRRCLLLPLVLVLLLCSWRPALAEPVIRQISLRGLQIGQPTRLVIEGQDLLPDARVLLPLPIAQQAVLPGATPQRVELEITLGPEASAGIHPLRIASAHGVSAPVLVGVDDLPQLPLANQLERLPAALHGQITGKSIQEVRFQGQRGVPLVLEVESARLGAKLRPVLRLIGPQGTQLAWSPPRGQLGGDARLEATLPDDGQYIIQLHDILYQGAAPGFFRLKIGDLKYADLVYPLGVTAGESTTLQFALTNIPPESQVPFEAPDFSAPLQLPAPLPPVPLASGLQPSLIVSQHAELQEPERSGETPPSLSAPPVAISGRLAAPNEKDVYLLPVTAGSQLALDMLARRAGSPVDGVLIVQDMQGKELARSDDRIGTSDPGVELKVPDGQNQLRIVVSDLLDRGGPDYIYRLEAIEQSKPSFQLTLDRGALSVPAGGTHVLRLQLERRGYDGPVHLSLEEFAETPFELAGATIPAGDTLGLLTLTAAADSSSSASVGKLIGRAEGEHSSTARLAGLAEPAAAPKQPWLDHQLALAVAPAAPLRIHWAGQSNESQMVLGKVYPVAVRIERTAGVSGQVRLRLLTTQVTPTKKVTENNQEKTVDDLERALRLDSEPLLGPETHEANLQVLVPPDLPTKSWGLVILAELLTEDNKSVVASAATPVRYIPAVAPPPQPPHVVFEDEEAFLAQLTEGSGQISLETGEKYSGSASIKVTPDQRFRPDLPSLGLKIRQHPAEGEYRYLRFAWKKQGGQSICLQLNHDGHWGPGGSGKEGAKFRYHAGPGGECYGASLAIDEKVPEDFIVVTRDLFADFGEFTLTGIALSPVDGEYGLFDHIYLGGSPGDFDLIGTEATTARSENPTEG